ncbi:MAG: hypothetical protein ACT4QC_02300 [Planctomycetaceae bacterium]
MNYTDCLGNQIRVGCTVAYPVRRKSSLTMQAIRVTWLGVDTIHGDRLTDNRQITLAGSSASRCVVVEG